jgi:hypothetical protein
VSVYSSVSTAVELRRLLEMGRHDGTLEMVDSQLQDQLPEGKQTSLGLYVTSAEVHEMWRSDPQHVHVIGVRTPEEYIFVGHPDMARNIPPLWIADD